MVSSDPPARSPATISTSEMTSLYRTMVTIRAVEQRIGQLYADGKIPGFVHLSLGQEGIAAGACWPLADQDVITTTHRGHGHCVAKGLDLESMFAELMAKEKGTNSGRAGSMHLCDPRVGIFGANGIVAAGLPIAVGAAFASTLRGDRVVTVAFFGDGAPAQGAFHEAVNLAALWRLPIIFLCENNKYAEFSSAAEQHPVGLETRASGYGVPFIALDGNDVLAVAESMTDLVGRVRAGGGPFVVEAETYRWHGHYEGDPERYRSSEERESWQRDNDPVIRLRAKASSMELDLVEWDAIDREVKSQIDAAVVAATTAEQPPASTLHNFVVAPRPHVHEPPVPQGDATYRYMDAIHDALEATLIQDPNAFLAGVDVAEGNVFGITRGLAEQWPDRVRSTPISETAIVGLGIGAAMAGMHPIVEVMYVDFTGVCFDQIINQAAKLRFMTGGAAQLPLVIRTQFGAGRSSGSQHSQSLEALFAHIPGLSVVMPSTPADAYGMLRAAIIDPNPIIFIEHRHLYGFKGPKPPAAHLVPIGKARVVRPGDHVTVVAVSKMVHEALAAADKLAHEGISVEVIDLRTIAPLDTETILGSVRRTGRLVVTHEAVVDFGIGAEVSAVVASEAFDSLDAPIARVGASATPPPYAPSLERVWLPDRVSIADTVRRTTSY